MAKYVKVTQKGIQTTINAGQIMDRNERQRSQGRSRGGQKNIYPPGKRIRLYVATMLAG
jgi:hypothetical protein